MSTRAGELLNIMRVRLGMQNDGTTNPHESVKIAMQNLVENLSGLNPEDEIDIVIESEDPLNAKYIHKSSQRLLAQINEDKYT